jgi:hypothetical protein
VTTGSPDYSYAFGGGSSTGRTFSLDFPGDPPAEALNSDGVGVGAIVLTATTDSVPTGRLVDDSWTTWTVYGASGGYAVIYRAADATDLRWWIDPFPTGYSCGRGVGAPPGETFDGFEPADCDSVVLEINDLDAIEFPNWT